MKTKAPIIAILFVLCAISKTTYAQPGSCIGSEIWSCFYEPGGAYTCMCVDSISAPAQQCAGAQVLACRINQHCDWECQCMDSADVSTWLSHGHNCYHGGGGGNGWWHHWHWHYRIGESQMTIDDETVPGTIYPNPVTASATISFSLQQPQHVSMKIVDLGGRIVLAFPDRLFEKGLNEVTWNAIDVPAGIYLLKMDTEEFSAIQKISVIK